MDSRASSVMKDTGSRSPSQNTGPEVIKTENVNDIEMENVSNVPREDNANSHTPAPAAATVTNNEADTEATNSRQSSSRPTDPLQAQESDFSLTDPIPYGTRSRNRAGNARPNYAEDQDMDFDFAPPAAKPAPAKGAATSSDSKQNNQAVSEVQRDLTDSTIARFVAANGTEQAERSPSSSREPIPGTSTQSTAASKKRKAAGSAATTTSGTNANSSAASQSNTKRPTAVPASIPLANMSRESNMMTFEKSKGFLKKGSLIADDGTALNVNDHVYLVCEPPGDPYYLCRIMEFLHAKSDDPKSPVDSIRVNWFYRPRDVQRLISDTRLVYGTMHSDICPLTSLRGKCQILHRSEISNLDEYRKGKNCFWFSQIFDRFIRRFYEVIPTSQIINVPSRVKQALDERWKFIAVEVGRVKELTAAVKLCKRCAQYCASQDSVDCAICNNSYHMNCVRPPLPKKPTRGFAWACGPCSRAQERRLEARNTPLGTDSVAEEEEVFEEEEEEDPTQNASTRAPSPNGPDITSDQHPGTQAEIAMAMMWPFRYLGIHCRVEDALQYDDRAIYPRASSRLGPRHQATVHVWHGRPVELVKLAEIKKRYVKGGGQKKDTKLSKETLAAMEADRLERAKRPPWVYDEPPGYVHRGEDYDEDDPRNTARLMFKMPEDSGDDHSPAANEAFIDQYLKRARAMSKSLRVSENGPNLLDKALKLLIDNQYNAEKALEQLAKVDRVKDLKEPILTPEELKKFEEGVTKYGSEHRLVRLHMKTQLPPSTIVRFYYMWKKTERGRQIWDNYGGRKGRKRQNLDSASKLQAEVAHDLDDSSFDTGKAETQKRGFQCKFCSTKHSRQWRRAPGVVPGQTVPAGEGKGSKDKSNRLLLALCGRCAGLWRRYAIQWEDVDEVTKKAVQAGGRAWKRKLDEEVVREIMASNEAVQVDPNTVVPSIEGTEPPKKKTKTAVDGAEKKKAPKAPTPPPPPIVPEQPRWRDLPCAVCLVFDSAGELPIVCSHCKLSVHKRCYGLSTHSALSKWVCEQCTNDRNPTVSTNYECSLCPVETTFQDLLEAPRVSHKKKTDREREKERLEKEIMESLRQDYSRRQKTLNRPDMPREPLKRTDGNNWVHVLCAVWTPEIRFSEADVLEKAEGFSAIPMERYEAVCKICKSNRHGACVSCQQCRATFHVGCAGQAGYTFGFDVAPVKSSRKDQTTIATLGQETGFITAGIWCREHGIKTLTNVHPINEATDDTSHNALQVFVQNYKQADQTLTGTARKANLLSQSTKLVSQQQPVSANVTARRISTASTAGGGARISSAGLPKGEETDGASLGDIGPAKKCIECRTDTSPRWWTSNETRNTAKARGQLFREDEMDGYRCNWCHWTKINAPPTSPLPSTQRKRVSLSPPRQFPIQLGWGTGILPGQYIQGQGAPAEAGAAAAPGHVQAQAQQQFAAPYQGQQSGMAAPPPGIATNGVAHMHNSPHPLPHTNGQTGLSNGVHGVQSPPFQQQPRPPPGFSAGQQGSAVAAAGGTHGSPPGGIARAITPRDGSVGPRSNGNSGASASPSLRNLLH